VILVKRDEVSSFNPEGVSILAHKKKTCIQQNFDERARILRSTLPANWFVSLEDLAF
jgi:hypothetical protein